MHIAVVANGELPPGYQLYLREILREADMVVAVDGGLAHCITIGITPNTLIGDLDSVADDMVASARQQGVDVLAFPADKDATDLELALDLAREGGSTAVTVVTPFGGRLDHELATIALLSSERYNAMQVAATDGRRRVWVVHDSVDLALPIDSTMSLVPAGSDVFGVTTTGLRWPLIDATLPLGTTRGVSNIAIEPTQSVAVSNGTLLVVVG